jgi:hypothetical protein
LQPFNQLPPRGAQNMTRLNKLVIQTLIVFLSTSVTACAEVYKQPTPEGKFVYSIQFNSDSGEIGILNKDREIVKPIQTNFPKEPLPVEAIIKVHTIIEAKGSCILIIDNKVYNICRH